MGFKILQNNKGGFQMRRRLFLFTGLTILAMTMIISILVFAGNARQDAGTNYKNETTEEPVTAEEPAIAKEPVTTEEPVVTEESMTAEEPATAETQAATSSAYENSALDTTDMFTERDLVQSPSLKDAVSYTVTSDSDIHISDEGTYVLTGTASNSTIYVEAADEAKVQLILDGLSITNQDFPCIYVTSCDKVFITTITDSTLSVTGTFLADGETNTDGVIFSRSDTVLNGTASLTINSTNHGIVSKDDLKVTGGAYSIHADAKALEANDSILVYDGTLELTAGTDGLHAENEEDDSLGYIYIGGGTLQIDAGDDAIHATSILQIDNGTITVSGAEGLEGTLIQINGGTLNISSWDDGINASQKSTAYTTALEINHGEINITMGEGDTDGIDSNGNLTINGGTISITGMSSFDVDGTVEYNGGTIIENGTQVDRINNQGGMRGMGGMEGMGDSRGGGNGGRHW